MHLGALGLAVDDDVDQQHRDRDHVVGDRRPHHRPERLAGVEDLPDQDVHPVEEDLRQAEPGEGDRRVAHRAVVRRGDEVDEQRRRDHQQHRHRDQEQSGHGDDPAGVGVAAVGVVAHRPHQLRHQDGVEDAAGQQDVEHVRQRVRDVEHVGVHRPAERVGQQRGPDEAASAARPWCRRPSPRCSRAGSTARPPRRLGRVGRLVGHLVAAPAGSFWSVGSVAVAVRGRRRRPAAPAGRCGPAGTGGRRSPRRAGRSRSPTNSQITLLTWADRIGEAGGRAERRAALVGDDAGSPRGCRSRRCGP